MPLTNDHEKKKIDIKKGCGQPEEKKKKKKRTITN